MAQIAVYDSTTGAIKRVVTCPTGKEALQVGTGEAQLSTPPGFNGDDTTHEIVDGEFAEITP